ncbi:hypothetical protein PAPYR_6750 [Paratrimastix pyriformis]|uniref:Uncharacterized protein n=1 Tax=Paratrimastix pyriformis TaxID=342808 RepID=A0ABQ8UJT8_9EUKA|nr:hypothetical protein PAPYR_6750 [Paratrimastix pyriformis]
MGASAPSVKVIHLVSAYSDTKQYLEKSEPTKFSFLSLFARSVDLEFWSSVPFSSRRSLVRGPLGPHSRLWYVSTVLWAYRNPPPTFSLAKGLFAVLVPHALRWPRPLRDRSFEGQCRTKLRYSKRESVSPPCVPVRVRARPEPTERDHSIPAGVVLASGIEGLPFWGNKFVRRLFRRFAQVVVEVDVGVLLDCTPSSTLGAASGRVRGSNGVSGIAQQHPDQPSPQLQLAAPAAVVGTGAVREVRESGEAPRRLRIRSTEAGSQLAEAGLAKPWLILAKRNPWLILSAP